MRVQPLHVLLLLAAVTVYLAVTVFRTKEQLAPAHNNAVIAQTAGEEIKAMKTRWEDTKANMGKLNSVAKHPSIGAAKVSLHEEKNKAVILEAKGLDYIEFDLFCDKALGLTVPLRSLSIQRMGDYNGSVKLEVAK